MATTFHMDSVNYSTMRNNLASHLDQCSKHGKSFQIVRNGETQAVLISAAEWEQILETLSIISDPKMMNQIIRSEKDIQDGRTQELEEAFKDLLG